MNSPSSISSETSSTATKPFGNTLRAALEHDLRHQAATRSLPRDEDRPQLEAVVEDQHVGGRARLQPAERASLRRGPGRRSPPRRPPPSGAPSACRLRTASSIVSTLPASTPSARRATPSTHLDVDDCRAGSGRRRRPVGATASVTSATRPDAARQTTCATSSGDVVAVQDQLHDHVLTGQRRRPRCPGSRWPNGRIALKRWVTVRAPRSNAGVGLGGGRVRVAERDDDAAGSRAGRSARAPRAARARASSGPPVPRRAAARAAPGRDRDGAEAGCTPSASAETNGPSRWAPRMRGPTPSARDLAQCGDEVVLGRRDDRRLEGRHAGLEQAPRPPAGSRPRPRTRSRRRRSRSPAGRRSRGPRSPGPRGPSATLADDAVDELEVARARAPRRRARPRRRASRLLQAPAAPRRRCRSSRARAVVGVDAPRAGRRSPPWRRRPAASSAASTSASSAPRGELDRAPRAGAQLRVPGDDVDTMRFP